MNINEKESASKKAEFFNKLYDLISEYPELYESYSGLLEIIEECDEDHTGFDPDLPKLVTGVVLCVAVRNSDDWEQLFWTAPYGQSSFMNVGILTNVLEMVK